MPAEHLVETDVLVIGGGMAGCFAAIKAKEHGVTVTLVDKGYVGRSGATHFSEGGFIIFNPDWGHKIGPWMNQINVRSEYINNRTWGETVIRDSYARYQDLASYGVEFDLKPNQIVSPGGAINMQVYGLPHRKYAPLLREKALAVGVNILDRIVVSELVKQDAKISGAIGFNSVNGDIYIFKAKATVLAAGGSSIKETNRTTHYWTSDGDVMAYHAGAEIVSKEFKFGSGGLPRSVNQPRDQVPRDPALPENDVNVLARYPLLGPYTLKPTHPMLNAENKPATGPLGGWWEAHSGRTPFYADFDHLTPDQQKDIQIYFDMIGTCYVDKVGLDYAKRGKVKVLPGIVNAVQPIHTGAGIWPVNTDCATAVAGLYAAGNNCGTLTCGASYASGGLGLCHAAVTGARAGHGAAEHALTVKKESLDKAAVNRLKETMLTPMQRAGGFSPAWVTQVLQGFLVPYFVLHMKHAERLQATLTMVEFIKQHILPKLKANDTHEWRLAQETKNMVLNSEMVLKASLFRTESRGGHYREDYPRRDDPAWLAWVKIRCEQGEMKLFKEPIPQAWWPDLTESYEQRYPQMFPGE